MPMIIEILVVAPGGKPGAFFTNARQTGRWSEQSRRPVPRFPTVSIPSLMFPR